MKSIALILFTWFALPATVPSNYVCKNATVSIYSKESLEDIDATSSKGISVFNASTNDLVFSVPVRSLTFQKSLMQEHFNEEYMESDKFPQASFKGKIQEKIDCSRDGVYPVTVIGVLEVHGVKQNRTISGRITVNDGKVTMNSTFNVLCKEHKIEIPTLLFHKIAESIQVKVEASYALFNQ